MSNTRFQQRLIVGAVLIVTIIILLGVVSKRSVRVFEEDAKMVEHTREVLNESEKILTQTLNAETAQRGYIITGNDKYLVPLTRAKVELPLALAGLRELISDNQAQVLRLDSLSGFILEKMEFVDHVIRLRNNAGFDSAKNAVISGRGESLSTAIRTIISNIGEEENRLLITRKKDAKESSETASMVFQVASVLVLLIILLLFTYVFTTFRKRQIAEKELSDTLDKLTVISNDNEEKNWVLSGTALLNEKLSGELTPENVCENALEVLTGYTKGDASALYLADEKGTGLFLATSRSIDPERILPNIRFGETSAGQAAVNKRPIYIEAKGDIEIKSALTSFRAASVALIPLVLNNKTKGVIELVYSGEVPKRNRDFLEIAANTIAISLNVAQAKKHLEELLSQLQMQSEELESQQEELRITNEELSEQTKMLQTSEEELRTQQEELMQSNAELEEKAFLLEENNRVMEEARRTLMQKTKELEESNRFKSDFLANMSHELRTPLNSILILARILSDNKGMRLNDDEAKYAKVIYNSGNDLLSLINDILDLAKIEAGKVELSREHIFVDEIKTDVEQLFNQVAAEKNIRFEIGISKNVDTQLYVDKMRLEQIIRNLLSNAFKFTPEKGTVKLDIAQENGTLFFKVKDTGIGISHEQQQVIFEAFQQADGSTSRKYGGTGLGLSISRELAALMGGTINVESEEKQGSTFTLAIPCVYEMPEAAEEVKVTAVKEPVVKPRVANNHILIVEDDPGFSLILKDFSKERGLEPFLVSSGEDALEQVESINPAAVILDISLPGMNGWEVLKRLKSTSETSNIPVHIISAGEEDKTQVQKFGAIGYLKKPVSLEDLNTFFNPLTGLFPKKHNKILVVEDAPEQNQHLHELFSSQGYTVSQAYTGNEAVEQLSSQSFDCMVLDMRLPDISGMDLLDELKKKNHLKDLPVVIYTASELSQADQQRIMEHTSTLVLKTPGSDSRILDEVRLFLHRIKEEHGKRITSKPSDIVVNKTLEGRRVLLVDDDMRNIFALSTALQQYGLEIEIASNGLEALQKIHSEIEMVLMDIMMPEMDGYEAITEIRKKPEFNDLPIIALTAKAMKEDRQKILEAGANDYLSKPVDIPSLISTMSVWLSK